MSRNRLIACLPLLLLGACQSWNDSHSRAAWADLQSALDEPARVEAARTLCQNDTTRVASLIADRLGAYTGSDTEAYLSVAIAKARPGGFRWLSHRVYGSTLEEAFGEFFNVTGELPARRDWPALVDALAVCSPDSPEADRWLALIASSYDGSGSDQLREAVLNDEEGSLRQRIRDALDHADMPKFVTTDLLAAFGSPRDETEEAWLRHRFHIAFEAALEQRELSDNSEFEDLLEVWTLAFPEDDAPVDGDDREIVRILPALLSDDEVPDWVPTFREIASFMVRHQRTGWGRLVEVYAEGGALPSNALSYVCRASGHECIGVLQSGAVSDIASAADVAPALDRPEGDMVLNLACGSLPEPDARQLSARGFGAGMPLKVRQAAAACLTSLGDDVSAQWKQLLDEALRSQRWEEAEIVAVTMPDLIDDSLRSEMIRSVRRGELRAIDVPWLLTGSAEGRELVRESILRQNPHAFDGLPPDAQDGQLAIVADQVRNNEQPSGELIVIHGCGD